MDVLLLRVTSIHFCNHKKALITEHGADSHKECSHFTPYRFQFILNIHLLCWCPPHKHGLISCYTNKSCDDHS